MTTVRQNLLTDPTYAPYCMNCRVMARMHWTGRQFHCRSCGTTTAFEPEFIERVIALRDGAKADQS